MQIYIHACSMYIYQVRLLAVLTCFRVWHVRRPTDRFSAPGSSDSHAYFVLVELVTSAGLTPFVCVSKSAAISGQTVFKELHSQTFCPTQKGQPFVFLPMFRPFGLACQLCILPCGHSLQHHQMSLLLCNVVLSGKFPFSLFLSWSHCSNKTCSALAKVGCFFRVPSAFLPAFALAHLGHPDL